VGGGSTVLVAEPGQQWDLVLLVRNPSREAHLAHVRDGSSHEPVEITDPSPPRR
jgi:hypothetical protein